MFAMQAGTVAPLTAFRRDVEALTFAKEDPTHRSGLCRRRAIVKVLPGSCLGPHTEFGLSGPASAA